MAVVAFDTLEMVKELKAAGFSEPQAEAVTRLVRRSHDVDLSDLATKVDLTGTRTALGSDIAATRTALESDIAATRAALESDIAATRAEMKVALAETKAEIIKWMFGTIGFQTLIILGAVIALARLIPG